MLLSAMSVLVVAQSSSEIPEGLMNNPVHLSSKVAVIICKSGSHEEGCDRSGTLRIHWPTSFIFITVKTQLNQLSHLC